MAALALATVAVMLLSAVPAMGQDGGMMDPLQPSAPAERPQTVTQVYSVGDLLTERAERPAPSNIVPPTRIGPVETPGGGFGGGMPMMNPYGGGGGGFGGGGGGFGAPERANYESRITALTSLISGSIAPDTWEVNGGAIGNMAALNQQLVITHTPEVQERIGHLLTALRSTPKLGIEVIVSRIPAEAYEQNVQWYAPAAVWTVKDEFVESLTDGNSDLRLASVRTTAFDGRTIRLTDGPVRTVVYDADPIVATGVTAWQPEIAYVQGGLTLQLHPTLKGDGTGALLDVSAVYAAFKEGGGPTTRPVGSIISADPSKSETTQTPSPIDRLRMDVKTIDTSLEIPLGGWVVVGGVSSAAGDTADGDAESAPVYLLVRIRTPREQ